MPRTIKKYANRRLYDTEASEHLTLDGVRRLVAEGHDIVVIDDTSGDDITRNVLLQILAEQEQGGKPILSTSMLKQLIRFYGNPMQAFMTEYLDQGMQTFARQQSLMEQQFRKTLSNTPMGAMQDMVSQNMDTWTKLQQAFMESMTPGTSGPGKTGKK